MYCLCIRCVLSRTPTSSCCGVPSQSPAQPRQKMVILMHDAAKSEGLCHCHGWSERNAATAPGGGTGARVTLHHAPCAIFALPTSFMHKCTRLPCMVRRHHALSLLQACILTQCLPFALHACAGGCASGCYQPHWPTSDASASQRCIAATVQTCWCADQFLMCGHLAAIRRRARLRVHMQAKLLPGVPARASCFQRHKDVPTHCNDYSALWLLSAMPEVIRGNQHQAKKSAKLCYNTLDNLESKLLNSRIT